MKNSGWMIRAGRGGKFFEGFEEGNYVAIGWNSLGSLKQYPDKEAIREAYIKTYGNEKPSKTSNAVAMIRKFKFEIKKDDYIITYSPERREYKIGLDLGSYVYKNDAEDEYAQTRKVKWLGVIHRDKLTQKSKNTLGSVLTLFALNTEVLEELITILDGKEIVTSSTSDEDEGEGEFEILKDQAESQSHEFIKDKIQSLLPEELEELTAAVLRAMGYKAKVSPKGPDRGVDVIASPDGLGLTTPRIKAEVKHRGGSIGAPIIRGFIGALRDGDSGLFVSTGGFTREARYEAERATLPLTLIDIDDLANLIVDHYESFDLSGRALIPLVRIYWPAE